MKERIKNFAWFLFAAALTSFSPDGWRPLRLRNVFRLLAFDRCNRDVGLLFSPELYSAGLSGDSGVVDVSPEVCLNSTDETNRNRGGCIFHEFCCCSDIEWVN